MLDFGLGCSFSLKDVHVYLKKNIHMNENLVISYIFPNWSTHSER